MSSDVKVLARIPTRTTVPGHGDTGCSLLGLPWDAPKLQEQGLGPGWGKPAWIFSLQNLLHHNGKPKTCSCCPCHSLSLATSPLCPLLGPYGGHRVLMNMRSLSPDLVSGSYLDKCLLRYARTGRMPENPRAHLDVPARGASRGAAGALHSSRPPSGQDSAARRQLLPLKSL